LLLVLYVTEKVRLFIKRAPGAVAKSFVHY